MIIEPFLAYTNTRFAVTIHGFDTTQQRDQKMDEFREWCKSCMSLYDFNCSFSQIYFRYEKQRTMFILRWS